MVAETREEIRTYLLNDVPRLLDFVEREVYLRRIRVVLNEPGLDDNSDVQNLQ